MYLLFAVEIPYFLICKQTGWAGTPELFFQLDNPRYHPTIIETKHTFQPPQQYEFSTTELCGGVLRIRIYFETPEVLN